MWCMFTRACNHTFSYIIMNTDVCTKAVYSYKAVNSTCKVVSGCTAATNFWRHGRVSACPSHYICLLTQSASSELKAIITLTVS